MEGEERWRRRRRMRGIRERDRERGSAGVGEKNQETVDGLTRWQHCP